jgi:starch-binding outer membrane protein, SusD/RagB family
MKFKIVYSIILTLLTGIFLSGCEVLEPEKSNTYDMDDVKEVVTYAEGVLLSAYGLAGGSHNNFSLSFASDDAVVNNQGHNVKTVVAGGWTSTSNPFSAWRSSYEAILYINTFLEEMTNVEWSWRYPDVTELYRERLIGEAYGLRAWFYFNLLQSHAGLGTNGQMLGVPLVDRVLDPTNPNDYQIPRSSLNDLVQFIIEDCNRAIERLPLRYRNTGTFRIDDAVGEQYTNRINGISVHLIKAKTLLYAASPAYSDGTYTYQQAAEAAAEIMNLNDGLTRVNFANHGNLRFFNNEMVAINNLHNEVFWYSSRQNSNSWERDNYPPSLYGNGRSNPTQDLVNAFPMIDGTPVTEEKLNSSDPYSSRDPRLSAYIFYNGANFVRGGSTITINTQSGNQDALGSGDPNTTLTGYYIRKFMNVNNVNLDPAVNSSGTRYFVYARYTDALLIFAEAANQAVGPDGIIGGFSARQVINAIRSRAGITSADYVNGLNQEQMVELIKNERRLEMCFEEQRFWDLRRWRMTDVMKQPVNGVNVSSDGTTYSYIQIENRNFQDYQIYGPIPFQETQKYDIIQNQGW